MGRPRQQDASAQERVEEAGLRTAGELMRSSRSLPGPPSGKSLNAWVREQPERGVQRVGVRTIASPACVFLRSWVSKRGRSTTRLSFRPRCLAARAITALLVLCQIDGWKKADGVPPFVMARHRRIRRKPPWPTVRQNLPPESGEGGPLVDRRNERELCERLTLVERSGR